MGGTKPTAKTRAASLKVTAHVQYSFCTEGRKSKCGGGKKTGLEKEEQETDK